METDTFSYSKKRGDLGKPLVFQEPEIMQVAFLPDLAHDKSRGFNSSEVHMKRDPNFRTFSNIPKMSENMVNTDRVSTSDKRMFHYEGGWPAEVEDITDIKKRKNYIKKKIERNPDNTTDRFVPCLDTMTRNIKEIIRENNQIDMYEEYFEGEEVEHSVEKLSVKTLMLFKDPADKVKRSISKISWHPDGPKELAAAYSVMRFQKQPTDMPLESYIWDLNNPNTPKSSITPNSPIVTLAYNHRDPNTIGFGCYNGTVGCWDPRDRKTPKFSNIENSHHDPVIDLIWLSSKGGNEFVTCSTDGYICWWDISNLKEPTERIAITESEKEDAKIIGATSLEYVSEIGPKYLVGTETGAIVTITKKPKNPPSINHNSAFGVQLGRHLGPVYSIKRNMFNQKHFLSIGDWSVWEDDTRVPIMRTRFHPSYLTDGCWAPNRIGLFFVTRRDGWLDIWDYYYRQNEVALSHKVSDAALTAIKLNTIAGNAVISNPELMKTQGKFAAIGDMAGTITLLELCGSLYKKDDSGNEKVVVDEIFKRETMKEKNLRILRNKKHGGKPKTGTHNVVQEVEEEKFKMEDIDKEFNKKVCSGEKRLFDLYESDEEMQSELKTRMDSRAVIEEAEIKKDKTSDKEGQEEEIADSEGKGRKKGKKSHEGDEEKKSEGEKEEEEKAEEEDLQGNKEEEAPEEEAPEEEAPEEEEAPQGDNQGENDNDQPNEQEQEKEQEEKPNEQEQEKEEEEKPNEQEQEKEVEEEEKPNVDVPVQEEDDEF